MAANKRSHDSREGTNSLDGSGGAGRGRRARLDPAARRAQIIDAACELLETEGVSAMSIEEVADAAGVSRSLVYTHFGDRDGLVAEVYVRLLDRISADIPLDFMGAVDRLTLKARVEGCLSFAEAHPAAWRLLVTDSVRRHPAVSTFRSERIAQITSGVDGVEAPLLVDAAWGLLETGVLHWVEQRDMTADAAAEMLATTLWSGLAAIRLEHPRLT